MNVFVSNLLVLYPIAFSLFVALRLAEATMDGRKVTFGVQVVRSMMFVLFALSLIGIACRSTILSILWVFLFSLTAVVVLIKQSRLNRSVITMTVLGVVIYHRFNARWFTRRRSTAVAWGDD